MFLEIITGESLLILQCMPALHSAAESPMVKLVHAIELNRNTGAPARPQIRHEVYSSRKHVPRGAALRKTPWPIKDNLHTL